MFRKTFPMISKVNYLNFCMAKIKRDMIFDAESFSKYRYHIPYKNQISNYNKKKDFDINGFLYPISYVLQ